MDKQIKAVIDLGTNTFKYVAGRGMDILEDGALSSRLGARLATEGRIGVDAMERGLEVLRDILDRLQRHHPAQILCVGAMTLRTASDAPLFIRKVKDLSGLDVRILSGQEEALLAWKAAHLNQARTESTAVLDIGGGSAELIIGDDEPRFSVSMPLGAVSLTARCIHSDPPLAQELEAARKVAADTLANLDIPGPVRELTVIGGTAVNLAAMQYGPENVEGSELSSEELDSLIRLLVSKPLAERRMIPGLTPSRADIIIAGALVLEQTLKILKLERFRVSTRGIRHALLMELSC